MHFSSSTVRREVLDRAAEPGRHMALEVRDDDKRVGLGDGGADLDGLEVLRVDLHFAEVVALEPVGDDQRRAHLSVAEAVLDGRDQVIDGVLAAAHVKRVAVGQERLAAALFDLVHDGADEDRAHVGVVALLPEVQLDGSEIADFDRFAELDGLDGLFHHVDLADSGRERREIDD